ncbi:MAG: threonine synthase [Firmicutes bacterium]|nr:threonine synthase [Bacillota bacterium]
MGELIYRSTRGRSESVTSAKAIVEGIAPDGGLYVPDHIPAPLVSLEEMLQLSYRDLAYAVMKPYLPDFTEEELRGCLQYAYNSRFDTPEQVVLSEQGPVSFLELYHGPTLAFKDMALSVLPRLMTTAAAKTGIEQEIVILTATSGDTGKAAMEGFADVPGVRIIVFFPKDGVSPMQKRQMVTQRGDNTHVIAVDGNFDDAQRSVKEIFTDPEEKERMLRAGYVFSSANSINIGRLLPQIVYYFRGYTEAVRHGRIRLGDSVTFSVPTGNFGDILAGHYAKKMGLPVDRLLCASNRNNVLTDFFRTGRYDSNREFYVTSSPSMDILVSSNLERLIYEIAGENGSRVEQYMMSLKKTGVYTLAEGTGQLQNEFDALYADEAQTQETIRYFFREYGYMIDPHTAVAASCALRDSGVQSHRIILSTASPYKFPRTILESLGAEVPEDSWEQVKMLSAISGTKIPEPVAELKDLPVRHSRVCAVDGARDAVHETLGI